MTRRLRTRLSRLGSTSTRSNEEMRNTWESPEILSIKAPFQEHSDWLATVTAKPRKNITSLADVPAELVTVTPVHTRTERPKTLKTVDAAGPWYPQLSKSFLLKIPDGFIGDNLIFDSAHHYSFGKWWLGNHEDAWRLYEKVHEVRHIGMGISITSWGGEAFQHFIVDTLPRLPALYELLEIPEFAKLKLVSHNDDCTAARWFWKKLDLDNRIVQKPKDAREGFVIHADLALYQDWHPNPGVFGIHPRDSLLPIQRRLGVLDGTPQDLVLYLGRRSRARSVVNNSALLRRLRDALKGTHLTLHEFEASGDLDRDMELVKRARIIIGPHGGAFANLVFAQPGTHVIEFLPAYRLYREDADPRAMYWGLAQAAGLDYWTVEPSNFDFEKADMKVDVEEVAAIVDQLVSMGNY